jgi:hypothetical protein
MRKKQRKADGNKKEIANDGKEKEEIKKYRKTEERQT